MNVNLLPGWQDDPTGTDPTKVTIHVPRTDERIEARLVRQQKAPSNGGSLMPQPADDGPQVSTPTAETQTVSQPNEQDPAATAAPPVTDEEQGAPGDQGQGARP